MPETIITGGEGHPETQLVDLGRAEVTAEHAEQTANEAAVRSEMAESQAEQAAQAAQAAGMVAAETAGQLAGAQDSYRQLCSRLDAIELRLNEHDERARAAQAAPPSDGVMELAPDDLDHEDPASGGEATPPAGEPAARESHEPARRGLKRRGGR